MQQYANNKNMPIMQDKLQKNEIHFDRKNLLYSSIKEKLLVVVVRC